MDRVATPGVIYWNLDWLRDRLELRRGGMSDNLRSMEGLRGFAVFLIFLVHYITLVSPWIENQPYLFTFANGIRIIGNTGVDLFFILSGYLIYGSIISRPQNFFLFISRRLKRIYPVFIVVFMLYLLLSYIFPAESKIPNGNSEKALYLLENFLLLPGLFPIPPVVTVAWSLSYEFFYYISIPIIVALFQLRKRSVYARVIFFTLIVAFIDLYCIEYGGPIRLVMFIAGIFLYECISSKNPSPRSIIAMVALGIGFICMLLPINGSVWLVFKMSVLFVSFFLLCLCCFSKPNAFLGKVFSWTPMRWLGNMSYSYYLIHGLALKAIFLFVAKLFPKNEGVFVFWGLMPVAFVFTLMIATLLFLYVERPLSLSKKKNIKITT